MADLTYRVGVETQQAQASLQKLQNTVSGTQAAFGRLNTAIGALAIGAAVRSAVAYADAIQDISDATGLAIESITGFTRAVELNGGNAEKAQAALVRFTSTIGEAVAGGKGAQDAFLSVGISLQDLATLSEQDLFENTLRGLGQVSDLGERARLQNELLGKSLRGVNLQTVANQYGAATAASARYADSIRQAAELQNKLDIAFGQFRFSVLKALEPLADFINKLEPGQIQAFVDAVVKIGGAAVAISALAKVFSGLVTALGYVAAAAAGAWAIFKSGTALVTAGAATIAAKWLTVSNLFREIFALWSIGFTSVSGIMGRVVTTFAALFGSTVILRAGVAALVLGFGKIALVVGGLIGVLYALREAFVAVFDEGPIDLFARKLENLITDRFPRLAAVINKIGAALGMAPPPSQQAAGPSGQQADVRRVDNAIIAQQDALNKKIEEERALLRQVEDAYAKQRKEIQAISGEFANQLRSTRESLALEQENIGKSEQQRQLNQLLLDLTVKQRDEVEKLTKAKAALTEEELKRGFGKEYDMQIAKIQQLAAAERDRLAQLTQGIAAEKAAFEFRMFSRQQEYDLEDKLRAIERERADLGLSEIEKKYQDITRAADDSARAAIRAEEARRGSPLSEQEALKYYERAREGSDRLKRAQGELYEQSRRFSTGWSKAFREYADNATNAAKRAEDLFRKATQGMEDAIVNFAKTGRFEWRNFVNMMLEELLRANIQASIASIMGAMRPAAGGGGGGGSILGGVLGGIFGGGGGRQQQPQSGGGGGSILGSIGSWINKNVFGGFFANGGTLPAGKIGIVGERGPEMISGPATITPMSGTTVNYYIQAVDAPSFQALVARDPGFIHAVAMQGARSMPVGRR